MARIGVIGAGYVGLTTAACFAHLGHRVVCADVDEGKVAALRRAEVGAHEPGLAELVSTGVRTGDLVFTADNDVALAGAEFVFLCLPTPTGERGEADLSAIDAVLGRADLRDGVLVVKSTVPIGTADRIARSQRVPVVSNPEFLREGCAVDDFLRPQRVVVGSDDESAARGVLGLYPDAPALVTDRASAELVKYASNCFLAMKLSYVNSLAELCERAGADIDDVTEGMRLDERIGAAFLRPGPGWGGSCFPKDTRALLCTSADAHVDFPLLRATIDTNERQAHRVVDKVREAAGPLAGARIGLLGLTFKAGTDDLRDSPALAVAGLLAGEGAVLTGYDPCVGADTGPVRVAGSALDAARDADALVVLTEWPEFAELDWPAVAAGMSRPVIVDTRNLLPADKVTESGIRLVGTGRAVT
ncbi:UDP-glucose dehydrogenase family protein [Saccharothrix algeriensis]|uniref:UDP-glucose 6-dehydrogenase n=1 Tax=Saccharothrix algeriensis TaxID=173560 RepID=A0A8T8I0Y2_9PSEU|nr:UDP-glucose/GDP-mannose dehydrogenase family protein [Saccharothrix algeriensis]MBM7810121.1 UDPglucose 6-dehydrogenase [Saccharothrix algeriensis]QTR04329.1 UDP-glucose/GDP-mannose dehydrogenase family protein [Saccharothrix algeriensis]